MLVLSIREYLLDKNEIEAETETANCIIQARKAGFMSSGFCSNIKEYKIKSQRETSFLE